MLDYIGKWRVDYERDVDGFALEEAHIVCKNNGEIYRYDDDTLVLYTTSSRAKKVEEELLNKIEIIEICTGEARIYFKEKYIKDFAEAGGAMIKGKHKKPVKNPRPKVEKTEEEKIKNYKYRVLVGGKVHKDNLNPLEASKLISELKKKGKGEIKREKYEVNN